MVLNSIRPENSRQFHKNCMSSKKKCISELHSKSPALGKVRRILGNHLADKDAIKKSFVANPTHHY